MVGGEGWTGINGSDLHIGILRRQMNTWMPEIHMKTSRVPDLTSQSYALQVRPAVKKFWFELVGECIGSKDLHLEYENACEGFNSNVPYEI